MVKVLASLPDTINYYLEGTPLNHEFMSMAQENRQGSGQINTDLSTYLGNGFLPWVCHISFALKTQDNVKAFG